MKKILLYILVMLFLTAGMAVAEDEEWITIGGDVRVRYDNLRGTVHDYIAVDGAGNFTPRPGYDIWNDALFLNRFGLNVNARATENITVKTRLLMYKVWGHETMQPVQGDYFADRALGPLDGTVGHVPSDNAMRLDQCYATWSNLAGGPVWISAGRRPSTGGVPTNLRQNIEPNRGAGREGVSGIMMDMAFDGMAVGYAPNKDAGGYAKVIYGKMFDSGYVSSITATNGQFSQPNSLKDSDYVGLNLVPFDTNNLHIDLQVQRVFNITNQPSGAVDVSQNVGDIAWWGGTIMGTVGDLNLFASVAQSKAYRNEESVNGYGLLWDVNHVDDQTNLIGTAFYLGGRYDVKSTGTKIGAEYNHGSQFWVGMVPAGDDIWTSKLGTRGQVWELYLIQELNKKPIMKRGMAFCRIGYQYYKFDYTGSNSWMGTPLNISDLSLTNSTNAQVYAPVQDAKDLYVTLDVLF